MKMHNAHRVAVAAILVMASASASAVVTSLDLGGASLTGAPAFGMYLGGYGQGPFATVDLSTVTVTSSGGLASFSFDPGVNDFYYGGFRASGNYSINGHITALGGLNVTANEGYVLDKSQAGYRITGEVSVTGLASVKLSTGQEYKGKGVRSVFDVYTFTSDIKLADIDGPLLYWYGSNPYYQGANGTASVFSIADIKITKIEYYTGITAVPEAGTWSLMVLGLAGLAALRRRHAPLRADSRH
jgi:MYXO-CTERM domain-containing protein